MSIDSYTRPAYDPTTDGEYQAEVHGAVAMGRFLAALAFAAVEGDRDAFLGVVAFPARRAATGRFGEGRGEPQPTAMYNIRHGAQQVRDALTA